MGSEQSFSPPTTHSRFSKVQISKEKQVMVVREPFMNITGINKWIQRQKLYKHIYKSPSLFICQDYKIELNGACSTTGMFIGKYEGIYEKTLKDEILIRNLESRYFTQEQIWYLILFVSKVASQTYQCGDSHLIGNIHPNNILTNKKGDYKIIVTNYSFSMPNQRDHFKEYQINGDSHAYVSPELIGFLHSTKYTGYPYFPKCLNKQVAQSFSLGLTIIAMATLNLSLIKIYKRFSMQNSHLTSRFSFNNNSQQIETKASQSMNANIQQPNDYLSILLLEIQKRYSPILYDLVAGLVMPDPQQRLRIEQIYNELLIPVEKYIVNLDRRWIQQFQSSSQSKQDIHDNNSRQICGKWARGLSNILKDSNLF